MKIITSTSSTAMRQGYIADIPDLDACSAFIKHRRGAQGQSGQKPRNRPCEGNPFSSTVPTVIY